MKKFESSIRKKYKEKLILNREQQWPPCKSQNLIRLELVESERGQGYPGYPRRGREDSCTPLAYVDLFKPLAQKKYKQVRKVLVEGDAGIGKTTFCTAISEDWANEEYFQQFKLVLLFPLRQKKVASAGCLSDLVRLLHPDESVCTDVASYLEKEDGDDVLVIADGWDELSEESRKEGSFIFELLFGVEYCLVSVVVTSRPSASASLHGLDCIDRIVKVRGFNKEKINEYILSEFDSDQAKASPLLDLLQSNPLVESLCSVPLNCAILCHLYMDTEDSTLPTTMTRLYTKMCLHFIFRNIQKIPEHKCISHLSNFSAIPKGLQRWWWLLCELAFRALVNDKIVFSQSDLVGFFPQCPQLEEEIYQFGLLQCTKSIFEVGYDLSYHFIHLTFQEYLAALHFVRQQLDTQFQLANTYFRSKHYNRSMVNRFIFGISFDIHYFGHEISPGTVKLLMTVLLPRVSVMALPHIAFESNNNEISGIISSHLLSRCSGEINGYSVHDFVAAIHLLTNIQEYNGLKIGFSYCGLSDNHIIKLTDVLASNNRKVKVKELYIAVNKLTDEGVCDLFHRASAALRSLECLNISSNSIGTAGLEAVLAKATNSIKTLKIGGNPLGVSGLKALHNAVCCGRLTQLTRLDLSESLTSDPDANGEFVLALGKALSIHCRQLKCLNLSSNNFNGHGGSALGKLVPLLNIDYIYLSVTNLGDEGISAFAHNCEGMCHTRCLSLCGNDIHADGISCLADCVCQGKITFPNEMELEISDNPLQLKGALAVLRMLGSDHCQYSLLRLSRCKLTTIGGSVPNTDCLMFDKPMTCMGVWQWIQGQQFKNSTVKKLILGGNDFSGEGIYLLAAFMHVCPRLTSLSCYGCKITSVDLKQLLSLDLNLFELEDWLLPYNYYLDDVGVHELIKHLPTKFPKLVDVNIHDSKVSNN